MASKIIKRTLAEVDGVPNAEIDLSDKGIVTMEPDMTRMWSMKNITRLTLSHNKIVDLPPAVAMMENLEYESLVQKIDEGFQTWKVDSLVAFGTSDYYVVSPFLSLASMSAALSIL